MCPVMSQNTGTHRLGTWSFSCGLVETKGKCYVKQGYILLRLFELLSQSLECIPAWCTATSGLGNAEERGPVCPGGRMRVGVLQYKLKDMGALEN